MKKNTFVFLLFSLALLTFANTSAQEKEPLLVLHQATHGNDHTSPWQSSPKEQHAPITNHLEALQLYDHTLYGDMPTAFKNLSKLKMFLKGSNFITGEIPTEICKLIHLDAWRLTDRRGYMDISLVMAHVSV